MKSLIEESSSIAKAIEKAWERANKPASFSVKIFELPEKNFIGMTTKYAKVALFFEDKKETKEYKKQDPIAQQKNTTSQQPTTKKSIAPQKSTAGDILKPTAAHTKSSFMTTPTQKQSLCEESKEITTTWTEPMKKHLQEWLKKVLIIIDFPTIDFSFHENKNLLKVNFDSPLIGNELKESLLYKNLSYLSMVSLRTHFKNEMKNLKILLSRE